MVATITLILTFSPGEKEQPLRVSGHADGRPAIRSQPFRRDGEQENACEVLQVANLSGREMWARFKRGLAVLHQTRVRLIGEGF